MPGDFALVYVVWNSIGNVRTQAGQVATFRNAARHLAPGGRFVVAQGTSHHYTREADGSVRHGASNFRYI